ncbi:hypothetical protein ACFZCE_17355, partial [Pseudomonas sp. NPDC007930]
MNGKTSLWLFVLCALAVGVTLIWADNPLFALEGDLSKWRWSVAWLLACLAFVVLDGMGLMALGKLAAWRFAAGHGHLAEALERRRQAAQLAEQAWQPSRLLEELKRYYGYFWRRQVRIILVVGEPAQIEAVQPGLGEQFWFEGEGVVFLWGGSVQAEPSQEHLAYWRKLCPRRPFDAIVWALSAEQSATPVYLDTGL